MPLQAVLFLGSARLHSHTAALGRAVAKSLQALGVRVTLLELVALDLPGANPEFHRDPSLHPDPKIKQLVQQATEADLFVFASPVYHNSYSGMLKNMLDHLAVAQFADKVVGLVSHGGNRTTQAVDQLRIVARGLNAIAIPTQVCTQDSDFETAEGELVLTDEKILERVERFTAELVKIGEALKIAHE